MEIIGKSVTRFKKINSILVLKHEKIVPAMWSPPDQMNGDHIKTGHSIA